MHTEIKGFKPDVRDIEKLGATDEERPLEEESSSDTTDAEEAGDIEELLNPGDPVYFNYATDQNAPPSLIVRFERVLVRFNLVFLYTCYIII